MARLIVACVLLSSALVHAADEPFGVLDIALGSSYARLERELDFRDVKTALAQSRSGKPDLGKRGYGCTKRDDPFADISCVSHQEKLDAVEAREIRLHFLHGRLQQFSLTAELQHYDAVTAYLHQRYGAPQQIAASSADAAPILKWQGVSGQVVSHRGKDLVFVSFELVTYADAVKRKREGKSFECS